jgi:hypothetical protein
MQIFAVRLFALGVSVRIWYVQRPAVVHRLSTLCRRAPLPDLSRFVQLKRKNDMIKPHLLLGLICGGAVAFPGAALAQKMSANERILELAMRQIEPGRGPTDMIGPDVIVGELMSTQSSNNSMGLNISPSGTTTAEVSYGIGTTSCNKGDQELLWISSTNQHPVISQNIYRIKNGRFEQLGQSWLKHGFTALQYNACGLGCQSSGTGSRLGVGCSDPYSASLNASQNNLGPRYQVNPFTGFFPYPFAGSVPSVPSGDTMARRLRVKIADVEPMPTSTIYIAEGQYVAPDDAAAGNGNNNASYRQFTFNASRQITLVGQTQRQMPAIFAWQALGNNGNPDPSVRISMVSLLPSDGLFYVGSKATDIGGGLWQYEYAVQNLNSDRMGGSFRVPFPAGTQISNVEWRGIDSHSGVPAEDATRNAPWTITVSSNSIEWAAPVAFNSARPTEGNGLRWSTAYNFRFVANVPPVNNGQVDLGFFKPGTPSSLPAGAWAPNMAPLACYANCDGSTTQPLLNIEDFNCFVNRYALAQQLPVAEQITSYANCDGSTAAPVLNIEDFNCFMNQFALGCP